MTHLDLDELERLEAKATPGKWGAIPARRWVAVLGDDGKPAPRIGQRVTGDVFPTVAHSCRSDDDAELIAALRNAFPALLAELRARREYAEAARQVAFLMGGCECLCVCADKEYLATGAHCQYHAIMKQHREAWQKLRAALDHIGEPTEKPAAPAKGGEAKP